MKNVVKNIKSVRTVKTVRSVKNAESAGELTELVCILDRSGSMSGLESDTVGGFNALIEKQKKLPGDCLVSAVLFSTESEVLYDRVPLADVKPMRPADYTPGGCTALLDAIGDAIRHVADVHKNAKPGEVPAHTIFVITTDGLENASRRYSSDRVKQMIEKEKEKYGWEFLFLAANIDAVETAEHIGISRGRAANYRADGAGTGRMFSTMAKAVCAMRCSQELADDWAADIEADARR